MIKHHRNNIYFNCKNISQYYSFYGLYFDQINAALINYLKKMGGGILHVC